MKMLVPKCELSFGIDLGRQMCSHSPWDHTIFRCNLLQRKSRNLHQTGKYDVLFLLFLFHWNMLKLTPFPSVKYLSLWASTQPVLATLESGSHPLIAIVVLLLASPTRNNYIIRIIQIIFWDFSWHKKSL